MSRHARCNNAIGLQVILSHATHLYFDLKYEVDPEEIGLYWASREIPLKKVFSYRPDSVYDNMDLDLSGVPVDRDNICRDFGCPQLSEPNNVIGQLTFSLAQCTQIQS